MQFSINANLFSCSHIVINLEELLFFLKASWEITSCFLLNPDCVAPAASLSRTGAVLLLEQLKTFAFWNKTMVMTNKTISCIFENNRVHYINEQLWLSNGFNWLIVNQNWSKSLCRAKCSFLCSHKFMCFCLDWLQPRWSSSTSLGDAPIVKIKEKKQTNRSLNSTPGIQLFCGLVRNTVSHSLTEAPIVYLCIYIFLKLTTF